MPVPKVAVDAAPKLAANYAPRFWDKTNKIEFASMVGLAAFDMGQMCHNLANGGREVMLPKQNCGAAVAMTVDFEAAAVTGAWLLHKTHHHKLERLPMLYMASQSLDGVVYSKQHGAW